MKFKSAKPGVAWWIRLPNLYTAEMGELRPFLASFPGIKDPRFFQ